jgi:hypothetical protein
LTFLGEINEQLGRYRSAMRNHQQAMALFRQLGNRIGQAWTHAAAHQHYQRAIAIYTDLDMPQADRVRAYLANMNDEEGQRQPRHPAAAGG